MKDKLQAAIGGLVICLGCAIPASAQVTIPTGASLVIPDGGAMDLGCANLGIAGSFAVNSGQVRDAGGIAIGSGGVLDGGSGNINVSGNWTNAGLFLPGSGSVVFDDGCASGSIAIAGATVFSDLTLTSTTGRVFVLPEESSITVSGRLTLHGSPGTPIELVSAGTGVAEVKLGPGAVVARSDAIVNSNVQIGAATVIPTLNQWGLVLLAAAVGLGAFACRRSLKN